MTMIYLPCISFLLREQKTSLVSKFGLNLIINQSVICYLSVHHLRAVTSLESTSYSSQEITNPWGQLSPVNYVSTKFLNRKGICELANSSVTLHSVSQEIQMEQVSESAVMDDNVRNLRINFCI